MWIWMKVLDKYKVGFVITLGWEKFVWCYVYDTQAEAELMTHYLNGGASNSAPPGS
jgi:hypothetical protein